MPTRLMECSTAEKTSTAEPTPVQQFRRRDTVEILTVTVILSYVRSETQSSSDRGPEMWAEDNRLSDGNKNSYETNFALDSIIKFL